MTRDKLNIIILTKKFNNSLNDMLSRFPNREKILKDKIKDTVFSLVYLIYEANYTPIVLNNNRILIQSKILASISLLDFLLEESYHKGYITEDMFNSKINQLKELNVKIRSWIRYGKNSSETNI